MQTWAEATTRLPEIGRFSDAFTDWELREFVTQQVRDYRWARARTDTDEKLLQRPPAGPACVTCGIGVGRKGEDQAERYVD